LSDDEFELIDDQPEDPTALMDVPSVAQRENVTSELPAVAPITDLPTQPRPSNPQILSQPHQPPPPPASSPPHPSLPISDVPTTPRVGPPPAPASSPPHITNAPTQPRGVHNIDDLVPVSAEHLVPAFGLKLDKNEKLEKSEKTEKKAEPQKRPAFPTIETRRAELPKPPPPSRVRIVVAVTLLAIALGAGRYMLTRLPPPKLDPVKQVLDQKQFATGSEGVGAAVDDADAAGFDEDDGGVDESMLPAKLRPDAGRKRDSKRR
jgi:hypothetical protein